MEIACPHCIDKAGLHIALMDKDDRFDDPKNAWRIECPACGTTLEGRFRPVQKMLLTCLSLGPVAVFWALFLIYTPGLGTGWLTLLIFLIHLGIGISVGMYLSGRAARAILVSHCE